MEDGNQVDTLCETGGAHGCVCVCVVTPCSLLPDCTETQTDTQALNFWYCSFCMWCLEVTIVDSE
jgi:hypothetical protein